MAVESESGNGSVFKAGVDARADAKFIRGLPIGRVILPEDQIVQRGQQSWRSPTILTGPFSERGKDIVLRQRLTYLCDNFLDSSIKHRDWTPRGVLNREWEGVPLWKEIEDSKDMLTAPTRTAFKVFFGTEARVKFFTATGLSVITGGTAPEGIVLRWGWEEWRHKRLLGDILVLIGEYDEEGMEGLERYVLEVEWNGDEHPGLRTEYGYIAYGCPQEKITQGNYKDKLIPAIRRDYGLVRDKNTTPEQLERILAIEAMEKARGYGYGVVGAIDAIHPDEAAHHGMYLATLRELARLKPGRTWDALRQTQEEFKMPLTRQRGSGVTAKLLYPGGTEEIKSYQVAALDFVNQQLGFQNREALELAANNSSSLQELYTEPGLVVLRKDGTFVPYRDDLTEMVEALK